MHQNHEQKTECGRDAIIEQTDTMDKISNHKETGKLWLTQPRKKENHAQASKAAYQIKLLSLLQKNKNLKCMEPDFQKVQSSYSHYISIPHSNEKLLQLHCSFNKNWEKKQLAELLTLLLPAKIKIKIWGNIIIRPISMGKN